MSIFNYEDPPFDYIGESIIAVRIYWQIIRSVLNPINSERINGAALTIPNIFKVFFMKRLILMLRVCMAARGREEVGGRFARTTRRCAIHI